MATKPAVHAAPNEVGGRKNIVEGSVHVEVGQRWVTKSRTDSFVIRGKSMLLVGWWTVESISGGARTTIDEPTLLAEFDLVDDLTLSE